VLRSIDGIHIPIRSIRALRVDTTGKRIERPNFGDCSGVLCSAMTLCEAQSAMRRSTS
jgi:hypothetical protein